MPSSTLLILGGIGAAILLGAIFLVVVGLRARDDEDPLASRLGEFAERGEQVTLEEIELSQPLTERIILPFARKLGELVLKFTPQNSIQDTAVKLERAGNPSGIDPTVFWALRFVDAFS